MNGIPSLGQYTGEQRIQKIQRDQKQAEDLFKKFLLEEMVKQMYKTTQFDDQESSFEKDFYREQLIRTLTDRIIERDVFSTTKKD